MAAGAACWWSGRQGRALKRTVLVYPLRRVLGRHTSWRSWNMVRRRARGAIASSSSTAACGSRACVGGSMRVHRTAASAEHTPQMLPMSS
eukprot:3483339-Prymnesium_polylepis.1